MVMHRGEFAIACNLGTEPVSVPVAGEVVLAWGSRRSAWRHPSRRAFVCDPAGCQPAIHSQARLWITDYRPPDSPIIRA